MWLYFRKIRISIIISFFEIAGKTGCPTFTGVLLHILVFILLLRGLMELKL